MLKYQYCLANVWWNISGQDQPLFSTPETMQAYFDSVRTEWSTLTNFTIGDSVSTSIYIRVEGLSTNEVLDYHYLIVRELNDDNEVNKTYHYFAELSQDSGNQYLAQLTRDVMIDYYNFGEVRNRPYTYIMRTHLDRFVNEGGKLNVNGANDSPLYIAEDLETDTPLCILNKPVNFTDMSPIPNNNGSDNNMWVYVYMKLSGPYYENGVYQEYYENGVPQGYGVIVLPLGNYSIQTSRANRSPWNFTYWMTYINRVEQNFIPYILNIRVSLTPPNKGVYSAYTASGNYFDAENLKMYNMNYFYSASGGFFYCVYLTSRNAGDELDTVTDTLTNRMRGVKEIFPVEHITKDYIMSPKNYRKEVKLYNGIIKANIASGIYKGMDYNLLSLYYNADNRFTFGLYESLSAGITRYYYGLACDTSIYNDNNIRAYNQNSVSIDTTIPYSESQLSTFLANNKNFYQQTDLEYNYSMITKGIGNAVKGFVSGNWGEAISGTIGAVADNIYAKKQREYQTDNLRNAPANVHNIDGNYMLIQGLTTLCPRFEIWQPLQSNLEKIADRLFFYGYTYQKLGKLQDFDNTRKYFNYIECDIADVKYNMNDKAFTMLREKLLNGVRLWHSNPADVDFTTTDNYEQWVDNME